MSLANLLKKGSLRRFATATPATVATVQPFTPPTVASVATVAVAKAPDKAANDPAPTLKKPETAPWRVTLAPGTSVATVEKFRAASLALDQLIEGSNLAAADTDPDRWCWPHGDAMNTVEIDAFTARLARFTDKGMSLSDAEALADKLVVRDREGDDRRLCLECRHLRGAGSYRCGNARAAGLHADLARDLVLTLHRCHGYEDARLPMGVIVDAAPPTPAPAPAPEPAPAPPGPMWQELDRAYLAHHNQCTTCQCAGRGYGQRCDSGMGLWMAYSSMNSDLKG